MAQPVIDLLESVDVHLVLLVLHALNYVLLDDMVLVVVKNVNVLILIPIVIQKAVNVDVV